MTRRWSSLVGRRAVLPAAAAALVAAVLVGAVLAAPGSGATGWDISADPTWSTDGTSVVVAYSNPSRYRFAAVPVGGGAPHTFYSTKNVEGCCYVVLSGAGGRLLFVANFTLTSVPESGGKATKLFSSTPSFILSPDGQTAAFDDGCGCGHSPDSIGFMSVAGGKVTSIPRPKNDSDLIDSFSPDGSELVFSRFPLAKGWTHSTVLAAPVAGGAPVPLARSGLPGATSVPANANQVKWSPDGRWIAFAVGRQLEVVSVAGGARRVLTSQFSAFAWAPDSSRIAYTPSTAKGSIDRLGTCNPEGGCKQLWKDPALRFVSESSNNPPQWSPDGSKLVFAARRGPDYPPLQVWTIGADGSGLTRIA